MGIRSWKKQYYPTTAGSAEAQKDDVARVKHSLRKWKGLRPLALKKHRVYIDGFGDVRAGEARVDIDASSCSLCVAYYTPSNKCAECPFAMEHKRTCTGNGIADGEYVQYLNDHNPEPMIKALEKTLEFVKKRKAFQAKKGKA